MLYKIYLALLLIIMAGSLNIRCQTTPNLQQQLIDFASHESLFNASWSIDVVDVLSGKPIISHNSNMSLVPASTQKVVTTASALLLLGSDYRYPTSLYAQGIIDQDGVLHGNLIIKGSGDPTLGAIQMDDSLALDRVFAQWLKDLNTHGIREITGSIIADDSVFDREMVPRKWNWEDIGNYYGAGSSGLTVHENMYTVFFQGGNHPGDAVAVMGTEPIIPDMILENQVSTGPQGSGDQVYIFGAPFSKSRVLTGTVPAGSYRFPVRGSLYNPPLYLATVFDEFLLMNSIITSGDIISCPQATASKVELETTSLLISTWWSPSLSEIAERTNLRSHNTYAENLLKTIGHIIKGTGNIISGTQAIYELWESMGIDVRGMRLHDGSGLSSSNRLTTRQLTSILAFCARNPVNNHLLGGLPQAGVSGSLENHFHNTASFQVLWAKSGFLSNVRSYAGYTTMQDGTLVAFAFIVNDYHGSPASMRTRMFRLMNAITSHNNSKSYNQSEP